MPAGERGGGGSFSAGRFTFTLEEDGPPPPSSPEAATAGPAVAASSSPPAPRDRPASVVPLRPRGNGEAPGSLRAAQRSAAISRWQGQRSYACVMSASDLAIADLERRGVSTVAGVTPGHLKACVAQWLGAGLTPSTVNKRLNTLSAMGVDVKGCRARNPRKLQWWLNPETAERARQHLEAAGFAALGEPSLRGAGSVTAEVRAVRSGGGPGGAILAGLGAEAAVTFALSWDRALALASVGRCEALAGRLLSGAERPPVAWVLSDYVAWTLEVGLRVEESLRLTTHDFTGSLAAGFSVTVPGTKTTQAQCTLPLSGPAAAIALRILARTPTGGRLFPVTYGRLRDAWASLRVALWPGSPPHTRTLKAVRRSAARRLTVNGMPLDILRQYLRHGDVKTTTGYLRLTGGYAEDEMRRWLG